jgi:hypothetical protein
MRLTTGPAGDQKMEKQSKRFTTSRWTQYLVPAILVLLALGLLATLAIVITSMLGLIPAG